MKPGDCSMNAQPKKLSKGKSFSQTTKASPLKGMAGFAQCGRVGGRVKPGVDCP